MLGRSTCQKLNFRTPGPIDTYTITVQTRPSQSQTPKGNVYVAEPLTAEGEAVPMVELGYSLRSLKPRPTLPLTAAEAVGFMKRAFV